MRCGQCGAEVVDGEHCGICEATMRRQASPGLAETLIQGLLAGAGYFAGRKLARTVAMRQARELNEAARSLREEYETSEDPDDLDQAIKLLEQAVEIAPEDSIDNRHHYADLGEAYSQRFRSPEDNDRAIGCFERALTFYPDDRPGKADTLNQLGRALTYRFSLSGDGVDISRAVETLEKSLALNQPDTSEEVQVMVALVNALNLRYIAETNIEDLNSSADLLRVGLTRESANRLVRGDLMSALSTVFRLRYLRLRRRFDLDEAVRMGVAALELLKHMDDRSQALVSLGAALYERSLIDRGEIDLEAAIEHLREAQELTPPGTPKSAEICNALGTFLYENGLRTGDSTLVREATELYSTALEETPAGSPMLAGFWSNLGNAYRALYRQQGSLDDLEDAMTSYENAVELVSGGPFGAQAALNYATALGDKFTTTGEVEHLDTALEWLEKASQSGPAAADEWLILSETGVVRSRRFEALGSVEDLELAVELGRRAATSVEETGARRALVWANLAGSLKRRYQRRGLDADLDEAIELYRKAVEASFPGERASYLNGLGTVLTVRNREEGREASWEDVDEAVRCHQECVSLTPDHSPMRTARLHNYGNSQLDRFYQQGELPDLEGSIESLAEAVAHTPEHSPSRAMFLNSLSVGLRTRADLLGGSSLEYRAHFREACRAGLRRDVFAAFTAGQNWGARALRRQQWREALIGLRYATRAMEELLSRQIFRADKESWLRAAQHIPADYAYVLARCGKLHAAVEHLENMRTRLLAHDFESVHARLSRLQDAVDTETFERYRTAAELVRRAERQEFESTNEVAQSRQVFRGMPLELRQTLAEIRSLPGLESYFQGPDFEAICSALSPNAKTAGVYLLSSSAGNLVLVVHNGEVEPIWLKLSGESLEEMLHAPGDGWLAAQLSSSDKISAALKRILPEIGAQVTAPIAGVLRRRFADVRTTPHITLIATGCWSMIPLHAAPYDANLQCSLLDDFVISYAPSARAILHASEFVIPPANSEQNLLAIAQTEFRPESEPLRFTQPEVEQVKANFKGRGVSLPPSDQTPEEVASALGQFDYLHFACHGSFDPDDPLNSRIEIGKHNLTMRYLLAEAPQNIAQFVALSACQSSVTDGVRLPQEVIGLPFAFLQMGVRNVLGSLWCVDDISTAILMTEFYRHHSAGESAAEALRSAQLWLKSLSERASQSRLAELDPNRQDTAVLDSPPPFEDPFYWAAFQVIGAEQACKPSFPHIPVQ
jgi:CHAT domain-containing protein/tetratricopeptide (TPR) repeat protein